MSSNIQRYFLLLTGATLALIGLAYCIDPNFLLSRYDLSVESVSDDNMYRGAYGGLFITCGVAISYGFFSRTFTQTATLIALLFMGGFALGRVSSILALGMPHDSIVGLLLFEVVSTVVFLWFLIRQSAAGMDRSPNAQATDQH